jgi:cellulose 1,4-beta-cellobiosidase
MTRILPLVFLLAACADSDLAGGVPSDGDAAPGGGAVVDAAPGGAVVDAAPGARVDAGGGGPTGGTPGNPFAGAAMYVNPDYVAAVEATAASPAERALLQKLAGFSTAIWLDTIGKTASLEQYLDDAEAEQARLGRPVVITFVVYDLPGRDCHANASNGELTLDEADVLRYRTEYIDVIAAAFAAHPGLRIAAIVEPDSLPNLATNLSDPRCAAAQSVYKSSVAYAIEKLWAPHVALYVDAAHSGWLGWPNNSTAAAAIFREVLLAAGGTHKIRGFAVNTANYSVLREVPEQFDYQFNPCHDELTYVRNFGDALEAGGVGRKPFVIDTSRNGRGGIRRQWGSWCNVRGAGIGERPVADPVAGVDAYLWIKPPGESDGTADPGAPRFDSACGNGNPDATPGAPQAGQWFASYLLSLVQNAAPPL